jgi:small subunit ribosomal protein S20
LTPFGVAGLWLFRQLHHRTTLRKFRAALQSGDSAKAKAYYSETVSMIDKAVKKGVIHKNTAARYKSRLNARLGK